MTNRESNGQPSSTIARRSRLTAASREVSPVFVMMTWTCFFTVLAATPRSSARRRPRRALHSEREDAGFGGSEIVFDRPALDERLDLRVALTQLRAHADGEETELSGIDRLQQVMRAEVMSLGETSFVDAARHHERGDGRVMRPRVGDEIEPAAVGQTDVDDHRGERSSLQRLTRLFDGRHQLRPTMLGQRAHEDAPDELVVLGDQETNSIPHWLRITRGRAARQCRSVPLSAPQAVPGPAGREISATSKLCRVLTVALTAETMRHHGTSQPRNEWSQGQRALARSDDVRRVEHLHEGRDLHGRRGAQGLRSRGRARREPRRHRERLQRGPQRRARRPVDRRQATERPARYEVPLPDRLRA